MRIGVIGCGDVAGFGHLPAIERTPGVELAALYDPDPARVKAMAARHGNPPAETDFEAFLAHPMDAAAICSPPSAHRANVEGAARRGLHVLCEKPIADDDEDAAAIEALMAGTGRVFMVGFVYRFSPVAERIRHVVRDGLIGDVRALRLIYNWHLHGRWVQDANGKWVESPRWRGRMLEGGPMVDCGVHQIDLARWWLGSEVERVAGHGAWIADYEAPDHVWAHLDHANGAHTVVEMSFSYGHTAKEPHPDFRYELIGTGGTLVYQREGWVFELRNGQGTQRFPGASEKNFEGMYAAFRDAAARNDATGLPSARDGRVATAIAWDATRQAMANR